MSWKNKVEVFAVEDRIEDRENGTSWVSDYNNAMSIM